MLLREARFTDKDLDQKFKTKISESAAFCFTPDDMETFWAKMKQLIIQLGEYLKTKASVSRFEKQTVLPSLSKDNNANKEKPVLNTEVSTSPKYSQTAGLRNLGLCPCVKDL